MRNHSAVAVLLILASAPAMRVHAQSVGGAAQTVLRAQVLLERAHFSPGEIDGRGGSNFTTALAGFQRSRNLNADGRLGSKTWTELERDAAPTLVDYTVLAADIQGPYLALPTDVLARSKLKALGYASADEALGEQFHSSPALLHALNPDQALDQVGGVLHVPNVLDIAAPVGGTLVRVDRSARTVSLEDKDGNTIAQFPASTGSRHDPLPVGDWKVRGVAQNPVFSYNPDLFWDAKPADDKLQLPPGPNNPVGLVWIDLSKEHYGIHGTPEPAHIGKTESHGCIRLTNWSAVQLAEEVSTGMPVVLQQ